LAAIQGVELEGNPMSVSNAAVFGAIAAMVVGGADYALTMKKHEGQEYGLLDHIEFRMGGVMGGTGVAKAMPKVPSGWDMREATPEDSLRITGLPVDPTRLAAVTTLNDKIMAAIPGLQTEDRLYKNGEAEIFLDISFVPANVKDSKANRAMTLIFSAAYDQAVAVPDQGDSALDLRKVSGPDYGKATGYFAASDGQIFISALSTASDEDTLALMAGIDIGALQLMVTNDPTIGMETPAVAGAQPEEAKGCVQKGAAKFCSANN
jgi:hypothetical protein